MSNKYLTALTIVLAAQAVLFYTASHGENTPLPLPLKGIPAAFGSWHEAQDVPVDDDTRAVLKADDILDRDYVGPEGHANLFVAYFQSQRTGQSPHSPKNCLPGSGFQPIPSESGRIDVVVPGGQSIHINKYVVAQGEAESVVLYWYQSQGRVIADEFAAKFYLVADSIRHHRSDTSLVRVVVPVEGDRAHSVKTAVEFAQTIYPIVDGWLPK